MFHLEKTYTDKLLEYKSSYRVGRHGGKIIAEIIDKATNKKIHTGTEGLDEKDAAIIAINGLTESMKPKTNPEVAEAMADKDSEIEALKKKLEAQSSGQNHPLAGEPTFIQKQKNKIKQS